MKHSDKSTRARTPKERTKSMPKELYFVRKQTQDERMNDEENRGTSEMDEKKNDKDGDDMTRGK